MFHPDPEPAARRTPRVLVVDDEPSIRELLAMLCAYEGWEVATADAGGPALRSARELPPDVVLLDMMLPDMDGLSVLRGLGAEHPRIAVLVVSAREGGGAPRAGRAAGAARDAGEPRA